MKKLIIVSIISLSLICGGSALAELNNAQSMSDSTNIIDIQDNRVYEGNKPAKPGVKGVTAPVGEIHYPSAPGRFDTEQEKPSYLRVPIRMLLEYDEDGFTTAEAKQMTKGVRGKRIMVRAKFGKVDEDQRLPLDANMPVFFEKQEGMKSLGMIVIVSDSKKSISADVFAQAQLEAWKLGGEALHVKIEGFQKEVHTHGFGVGFSWTGTTISGGQTSAATGVMGAGATWGQAGYYDHPFVILHVLAAK